jgi:hypothetical protein
MNTALFEKRLSVLFCGGERLRRELRLTPAEYDYLVRTYPAAALTPMGENWYELVWKEAR